MAIRFPQRRRDGSFDVIVQFDEVCEEEALLRSWISQWAQLSASWQRVWEGAEHTVEVLVLLDDFFSPPVYESQNGKVLSVRFRARPSAKMWKDWVAKFAGDFIAAHPSATVSKVESASLL